jgi:uncharacterized membrane protein YjjP (DUF1212 family)
VREPLWVNALFAIGVVGGMVASAVQGDWEVFLILAALAFLVITLGIHRERRGREVP